MMLSDKFLESLPSEPNAAAMELSLHVIKHSQRLVDNDYFDCVDEYVESVVAFGVLYEATGKTPGKVSLAGTPYEVVTRIVAYYRSCLQSLEANARTARQMSTRAKYEALFGRGFVYEFSDGDLALIQMRVNELRDLIAKSKRLDEKHKERILKKLEALQRALHKKMSSLDKLWGLVGEAGVILHKFGEDAKPLVDRIREIAEVTWATQARAEELPSGTPIPRLSDDVHSDE